MIRHKFAALMTCSVVLTTPVCVDIPVIEEPIEIVETVTVEETSFNILDHVEAVAYEPPVVETSSIDISEKEPILPTEDIELIALVTMAEAEGESEEGKRYVIDTILNRMDSEHFPDSAHGVIYQANQFTSMWNGRVDKCYVDEDIYRLVEEELESRTNYDVVFFRTKHYSAYGEPLLQVGNHYFSSYN